jgi:hypothetical protein
MVLLSSCFRGELGEVKYCWKRGSSCFGCRNKFKIVLSCGLLIDNNKFQKYVFLKVLLATLVMVVMKAEMIIF